MKNRVILLLLISAASSPASAFDWGLEGRAGYTHSDNVAQAPAGDSADILGGQVSVAAEHASRKLILDAEANYAYRYFLSDDYGSEAQPQLRAELEWLPLPEHLRITVTDVYGQLALNPAEGLLPSQYENSNVATLGPTFVWPLSLDTRMQVSGEYRYATFDVSPVDTQRRYGELRVEHDLTRLLTFFGGGSTSHTEFDLADEDTSYDVDSVFFGFDAVGRRSALSFDAGLDRLEDDNGESFDGARYDLTLERLLGRDGRIFVGATREIADAADVFSLAQMGDPALTGIRDVQVVPQPMVRDAYLLGYARSGHRLSFAVTAGYRKEDFRLAPTDTTATEGQDRDIRELQLDTQYIWSQRTTLVGRAEVLQERFDSGVSSDDLFITLSWLRRIAPRLRFEAQIQRIERSNSPRNFQETRFLLYLYYTARQLRGTGEHAFDRAFERRVRHARDAAAEGESAPPAGAAADLSGPWRDLARPL